MQLFLRTPATLQYSHCLAQMYISLQPSTVRPCASFYLRGVRRVPLRSRTAIVVTSQSSTITRNCVSPMDRNRRSLAFILSLGLAVVLAAKPAAACDDYIMTRSGLEYCDVEEGTGEAPVKGSMIRAHYTGRLASNNEKFDSSYDRRRPLSFKIGAGQVIQGWDLGILGDDEIPAMKAGGKRKLVIPPELGYGSRGAGNVIPPGATLLFDVELLPRK